MDTFAKTDLGTVLDRSKDISDRLAALDCLIKNGMLKEVISLATNPDLHPELKSVACQSLDKTRINLIAVCVREGKPNTLREMATHSFLSDEIKIAAREAIEPATIVHITKRAELGKYNEIADYATSQQFSTNIQKAAQNLLESTAIKALEDLESSVQYFYKREYKTAFAILENSQLSVDTRKKAQGIIELAIPHSIASRDWITVFLLQKADSLDVPEVLRNIIKSRFTKDFLLDLITKLSKERCKDDLHEIVKIQWLPEIIRSAAQKALDAIFSKQEAEKKERQKDRFQELLDISTNSEKSEEDRENAGLDLIQYVLSNKNKYVFYHVDRRLLEVLANPDVPLIIREMLASEILAEPKFKSNFWGVVELFKIQTLPETIKQEVQTNLELLAPAHIQKLVEKTDTRSILNMSRNPDLPEFIRHSAQQALEQAALNLVDFCAKKGHVKRLVKLSKDETLPESARRAASEALKPMAIRNKKPGSPSPANRRDGEFQKWTHPKDRIILCGGGAHNRFRAPAKIKL
ncbi:hypothetical protein KJ780_03775 [Candidatus Micrarchaeota archaeon]|nr:hypothetical protein [Candidatus Micrarchaeota archaeon]